MDQFNILHALLLGGGLVGAYQLFLGYRERHSPGRATHVLNALARTRWVEAVMSDPRKDVMAVQTLRNSVMAASMMASTAILLVVGTLNLGADGARLEEILRVFSSHVRGSA